MEKGMSVFFLLLLSFEGVSTQTVQAVLQTCQQTRDRLEADGYDVSAVPTEPISGQFLQLCPESTETCCNSAIESKLENATTRRLATIYPPSFITQMLDALIDVVNSESYDEPDRLVTVLIRELTEAVSVSHASNVIDRLLSLRDTVTAVHDSGDEMGQLSQQLKHFFAHILVLNLRANTSLPSSGGVADGVVTCVAEEVLSEDVVALGTPTGAVFRQMRAVYLIREIVISMFHLATEDLNLEGDPFAECVRAHAELNLCQSCVPLDQVPSALPCKNACMNVMIGCTAFFERFRYFVHSSGTLAATLDDSSRAPESSLRTAVEALVGGIQKLNGLSSAPSESGMDVPGMLAKIEQCIVSDAASRTKRETLFVKVVKSRRRFLRQLSGAVNTDPVSIEGLPHSVTSSLYTKVFEQLEEQYFSQFDGLSLKLAEGQCGQLPTSQCWNQQSVGNDITRVVSPGPQSLTSNPNLGSKGDTEIEINTNNVDDRETNIEDIQQNTNDLLGIGDKDASAHTAVQGALVVMATLAAAILMQLL